MCHAIRKKKQGAKFKIARPIRMNFTSKKKTLGATKLLIAGNLSSTIYVNYGEKYPRYKKAKLFFACCRQKKQRSPKMLRESFFFRLRVRRRTGQRTIRIVFAFPREKNDAVLQNRGCGQKSREPKPSTLHLVWCATLNPEETFATSAIFF